MFTFITLVKPHAKYLSLKVALIEHVRGKGSKGVWRTSIKVAEYYLKFIATSFEPHHSWLSSVNRLAKGKLKAKVGLEFTF